MGNNVFTEKNISTEAVNTLIDCGDLDYAYELLKHMEEHASEIRNPTPYVLTSINRDSSGKDGKGGKGGKGSKASRAPAPVASTPVTGTKRMIPIGAVTPIGAAGPM